MSTSTHLTGTRDSHERFPEIATFQSPASAPPPGRSSPVSAVLCAETRDQSVSPWAHSCFLADDVLGDDQEACDFCSRGTALARCASPRPKEKFSPGAS